jgi:hypothetical protein
VLLFDFHRSGQATYRLLSHWKVIPHEITFEILSNFQPNQTEIQFVKEIALPLWGNPPLLDLDENLTQCREYHREQLCNWSKVGRSLGLTCGGQNVSLSLCASGMRVRERNPSQKGPSLSPVSLTQERGSLI